MYFFDIGLHGCSSDPARDPPPNQLQCDFIWCPQGARCVSSVPLNQTKTLYEGPVINNGYIDAASLLAAFSLSKDLFVQEHLDIFILDRMNSEAVKADVIAKVDSATDVVSYGKASPLSPLHSMKHQPEQSAGRR